MSAQVTGYWRLLEILTIALALSACASGPPGHEETSQSWQEEVQLEDGRVIVVERTEYYSAYCGPGVRCGLGKRGGATRSKIEFESDGKSVIWEHVMRPMILQINGHRPTVVARFANGNQEYQYLLKGGERGMRYLAFRYDNGAWQRIPLSDTGVPPDANLLVDSAGFGSWTSLERKKELNGNIGIPEWLRRVPLNLH